MNLIDGFVLIFLALNMFKGYSLGLVLSFFNFLQVIISIVLTRGYYMNVYGFFKNSKYILAGINRIIYFFLRIIFFNRIKSDPGFLEKLLETRIMDLILVGISILLVYIVSTVIIDILFSLFSFLINLRFFRRLDRYGGLLFGLLKGILSIFIINSILRPIFLEIPDLFLAEAFLNSKILEKLLLELPFLKEGIFSEEAGLVFRRFSNTCRSFIPTL